MDPPVAFRSARGSGSLGIFRCRLLGWPCVVAIAVTYAACAAEPPGDTPRAWPVARVEIDGADFLEARRIRGLLSVSPRPWYTPWRDRPRVSRSQVEDDVARVRAYYRTRGRYHATVTGEVVVDAETGLATVRILVDEGRPVRVGAVQVELQKRGGVLEPLPHLTEKAGVKVGDVFTSEAYEQGRLALRRFYRERRFARVRVEKHAVVDVRANTAEIRYLIRPGPPHCVFGEVTIEGLQRVTEDVVRREIAFAEEAPFDLALIEKTVAKLRDLNLFHGVRAVEDEDRDRRVDFTIVVREAPHREVRLGVGYDTEEGARGLAGWRSYDFLGGARQLGFSARASFIRRTIAADFLQPHQPFHSTRLRLLFLQEEQEEDGFTVLRTRLMPRLEWDVTRRLSARLYYRIEYDDLRSVETAVERALAADATPNDAVLSGVGLGVDWVDVDDVLDPTDGWSLGADLETVGGVLGGDTDFVRLGTLGRGWAPLPWHVVVASRLAVGTLEPVGDTTEVPVWERAYAGGTDSVRGYARHRVGPLAVDEPIGGQSWFVGSIEIRRTIWKALTGAVFVDAGHVARESFSLPFNQVQVGVGTGLRVATPLGPLRLDVGVPIERRGDDAAWQLHFAVGQAF